MSKENPQGTPPITKQSKGGTHPKSRRKPATPKTRNDPGKCPYCGRPYENLDDRLEGIGRIIEFCGIPPGTFYRAGYIDKLLNSRYIFARPGPMYGRPIWWSYKNLIICWLVDNFQDFEPKRNNHKK